MRPRLHASRRLWLVPVALIVLAVSLLWLLVGGRLVGTALTTICLMLALAFVVLASNDRREMLPAFAGACAWWLWMVVYGLATDALEGTRFDWIAFVSRRPNAIALCLHAIAGFGVATGIGVTIWYLLRRRLQGYPPGHCRRCGYDLAGIDGACPECGEGAAGSAGERLSPLADNTPAPARAREPTTNQ